MTTKDNYCMIFPRKIWELKHDFHCTKEELDNAEVHSRGFIKTV
jgi:hypothetical protein